MDDDTRGGPARPLAHAVPALVGILFLLGPGPAAGQQPGCDPCTSDAAWPFPPPAVSPLEPRTRLAPVHVSRGERSRWVGLVDLGDRFPFWLVRRGGGASPALAASVTGGAFSRFDLESSQNDFIEVHYRVGLRLLGRLGGLDARLELFHVSSHLGDEFLRRTGREPVSTSREGLELLLSGRPADGLRVYGGPGLLVRSSRAFDAASLRGGLEWDPAVHWGTFRPYVGIAAYAWEELSWEPTAAAEAGLRFGEGRYRLALTAGAGRSRAEQFLREEETLVGITLSADF
jgi:hypothetical protein